jgi:hypothetical protein
VEDDDDPEIGAVAGMQIGSNFRPWRSCTEGSAVIQPSFGLSENPQNEFPEKAQQAEQGFHGNRLLKKIKEF